VVGIQWVAATEVVKILDINLHGLLQCRDMPKMMLLGDAKRPKVADAVIEAFYCAEALLLAKGHSFSSHRAVISAFAQHYVKSGALPQELHQWLRTAFAKR
jgi:hypothetical protein